MVSGNNGLMSCIDRILEGHNHDLIVFQKQKTDETRVGPKDFGAQETDVFDA